MDGLDEMDEMDAVHHIDVDCINVYCINVWTALDNMDLQLINSSQYGTAVHVACTLLQRWRRHGVRS
jgi:hypothetical protein